jgi:chemotaxis protein methyltransferase CheR
MQSKRLTYGAELLRVVCASNVEYDGLLERLLTQETSFLRYPGMFSAFEQHVLPEIESRNLGDQDRGLRIWSAGCASGEEPYSIALSICEAAAAGTAAEASIVRPEATIMATDISREALERAGRAVYSRRVLQNLSGAQIANYFTQQGDSYQVKAALREMVKFAPMNLAQPLYLGRFDCIFCMNVLIYFGAELRSRLIQRFYEYLEPGGYLFLGHAESVANVPVNFHQTFMNGARLLQKPLHHPPRQARAAGGEA